MRKILGWSVGVLVAIVLGVFGLQILASETGEVAILHTKEGAGEATTRVWVVERDGDQWLRSGGGESGWYRRLVAVPRIGFERRGRHFACDAQPDVAVRDEINTLMNAKYGWRDDVIGLLVGGRETAVPVRLRCVSAQSPAPL